MPVADPTFKLSPAQQQMVAAHVPLANTIAKRAWIVHRYQWGNRDGQLGDGRGILIFDDFLSAAALGLCLAARAYKGEYRAKDGNGRTFGVYCKAFVHGEVYDMTKRHRWKPPDEKTPPAPFLEVDKWAAWDLLPFPAVDVVDDREPESAKESYSQEEFAVMFANALAEATRSDRRSQLNRAYEECRRHMAYEDVPAWKEDENGR